MSLNPIRRWRRWRRFREAVREEVHFLIARYGAEAKAGAQAELRRGDLSPMRVKLLTAAAQRLSK